MSSRWPGPGIMDAGMYQISGIPYVTSSAPGECAATGNVVQIKFPSVTRWFQIALSGSGATDADTNLRIGFTENGVNGLGATTGSLNSGEIDEYGDEVWMYINPFSDGGVTTAQSENTHKNYFTINAGGHGQTPGAGIVSQIGPRFELMCTDIFLRAEGGTTGFTIIAGLTGISRDQLGLSGSFGMFGVG